MNGIVVVEPHLPAAITSLETAVKIGNGRLTYIFKDGKFDIRLENVDAKLVIKEPETPQPAGNAIFDGVDFCHPDTTIDFPCMKQRYNKN